MITECKTKTVTEIVDNKVTISCLVSENQDGVDTPTLFRTDMLDKPSTINRISGQEGDLLITHVDSDENVVSLNKDGEMILTLQDDEADKYNVDDNGYLVYNG